LRSDRIDAPCLFDGRINGERFRAYVEQVLVPTLKAGDVVILDNLGSHKGKAVRKAIRHVGARLVFLPKYSPDLNPIEQVFAKVKTLLRKAGARTTRPSPPPSAKFSNAFRQANAPPTLESVRKHHLELHNFRVMRRIEASLRKASALRLRHSQSLASLRHRPSQAKVRSTIHRLGKTTKCWA
jgi:transposase